MVRLVSGIVLAAAAIGAVLFLPIGALRVVAVAIAGITAHEYLRIVGTRGTSRQVVGIAATVALCAWIAWGRALDPVVLLLAGLGWVAADVLATGRPIQAVAADVIAPLYVGVPLGMLVMVHVAGGSSATLLVVALVIVSDSAQYYSGRMMGRHALAPAISPKKTIEGAVGGLVSGTAFLVLAAPWVFPAMSLRARIGVGAAAVVLGICGDLFESRLKRAAGMKDSSSLIPGHGGALDRLDALLFVVPAFYLYVRGVE